MASASAGQARSSMTARALSGQGRGSPLQLVPPGMVAPRSLLTTLQVSLSLHLQCCLQCTQVPRSPVVDDNTVMSDLHIKLLFHGATCHLTHTQCPAGTVKIALCQPFLSRLPNPYTTYSKIIQTVPTLFPTYYWARKFVLCMSVNSPATQSITPCLTPKHLQCNPSLPRRTV